MATPQTLNIALLDTDTPVPSVLKTRGLYSAIFQRLLEAALIRISKTSLLANQTLPKIQWTAYNSIQGEYPPDISALDAVVISGSVSSAYDSDPWISALHSWIRAAFTTNPRLKFFGSCFGHQVLCSALLSPLGGRVVKNPAGWELGVHPVVLSDAFTRSFPIDVAALPSAPKRGNSGVEVMRVQLVHADHVVLPPPSSSSGAEGDGSRWQSLGSTPRCAVQGVYDAIGGRMFTLQGHFEFDRFINGETIKVFGTGWGEEGIRAALRQVDADDDAEWAAEIVMVFLMGLGRMGRAVVGAGGAVVEGGLMTPPEEV